MSVRRIVLEVKLRLNLFNLWLLRACLALECFGHFHVILYKALALVSQQLEAMGYGNRKSIRGNVVTRLAKLDAGEYDGIILAAAGIKRSGLEARISQYFTVKEIIPAACQGNLAIQGRAGEDHSYLQEFHDSQAEMIANAERAFVRKLDGGCSTPTAAYATIEGEEMAMQGYFQGEDGRVYSEEIRGSASEAEELGTKLAVRILDQIQ